MSNETPVSIRMTVAEWNQVIAILSEHPFRIVAPLIGKIHGQAMTAIGGTVADGPLIAPPQQGESHGMEN
jgi:hypothetical protein